MGIFFQKWKKIPETTPCKMYIIHVIMYIINGFEPFSVHKKRVNTYRFTYFLHIFQDFPEPLFANTCSG